MPSKKAVRTDAFLTCDAVIALFHFVGLAKPLPFVLQFLLDQVLGGSGIDILIFGDGRLTLWALVLLHFIYAARAHERRAAFRANHDFANDKFHTDVALACSVRIRDLRHLRD